MAATLELLIKARDEASGILGEVDKKASGLGHTLGTGLKIAGVAAAGGLLAAVAIAPKFIGEAANLGEAANKVQVVFGDAAAGIRAFADQSARSLGIAESDALAYAGTLGTILKGSGLTQDASAGMSQELVKLAADMASFNNIPIGDALEKIRAGLVGESEPLRTVGVLLSEAAVKQKAYEMGIAATGAELTDAQKVQARYALILEQTKDTQGDFARTSGGLANQQRILSAQWKDLQATLGQALLPVVTRLARALTEFLSEHQEDIDRFAQSFAEFAESDALPFIERAFEQLQQLIEGIMDTGIIQWIAEHKAALIALGIALGVLVIAFGGPIPIIIALVAAGTLLLANWDSIRAKANQLWQTVTDRFNSIIATIQGIPILGAIVEDTFNTIKVIAETYLGLVIVQVQFAIDTIRNIFNFWRAIFTGDWDGAWNALKAQAETILTALQASFGIILDGFMGILNSKLEMLKSIGSAIANAIADGFKAAWNALADAINKAIPNSIGIDIPGADLGPLGKVGGGRIELDLPDNPIPKLAQGGRILRSGLVELHPPEIVFLPAGAQVASQADTRAMLGGAEIDYDRLAAAMASAMPQQAREIVVQIDGREIGRAVDSRLGSGAYLRSRGG